MAERVAALLLLLSGGCSSITFPEATGASIEAANVAQRLAVEACDARERQIVERQGSTQQKDEADIAEVRSVCDQIFEVLLATERLAPLVQKLHGMEL